MEAPITLKDLTAAIDRCRAKHPPEGEERRMHPDANLMADLWAPMVLGGVEQIARSEVSDRILAAIERWATQDRAKSDSDGEQS